MMFLLRSLLFFAAVGSSDRSPHLDVRVLSDGRSAVAVAPGETVRYVVVGELGDDGGLGLASLDFDLALDGGSLPPAEAPTSEPMIRFAPPGGLSNPGGFGGTPSDDGSLLQVGGAQNTIGNQVAPAPRGTVKEGVAVSGHPVVLVRGAFRAPREQGEYTLDLRNLHGNVLRERAGSHWVCDEVRGGTVIPLAIWVTDKDVSPAGLVSPSPRSYAGSPDDFVARIRDGRTVRGYQPRMGEPLAGLTDQELRLFKAGRQDFVHRLTPEEGLGPLFNNYSCVDCHAHPAPGGFGTRRVVRFGRQGPTFDPLEQHGGTLLQDDALSAACAEFVPPEANVVIERVTTPLFGAGLVELILDADLLARENDPPVGVTGRGHHVVPLEGGPSRVGRFGWKSQIATLLSFSAEASRDEMGLTNRLLPSESAPNGDAAKLVPFDRVADPEDRPDEHGFARIDRWTHFQRMLAPPPQTPRSGTTGERLFVEIGCAACHTPSFQTPESPNAAFSKVVLRPYSDFLLHDMGSLGDGIVRGDASASEMRTAPLWGIARREALLHDGRASGASFAENAQRAILAHDGEAASAREAFVRLEEVDRARIVAFLRSLGQAEFDADGNGNVDAEDWVVLAASFTGPGPVFTPNDPLALADVDADGDFDLADYEVLIRAFTGSRASGQ